MIKSNWEKLCKRNPKLQADLEENVCNFLDCLSKGNYNGGEDEYDWVVFELNIERGRVECYFSNEIEESGEQYIILGWLKREDWRFPRNVIIGKDIVLTAINRLMDDAEMLYNPKRMEDLKIINVGDLVKVENDSEKIDFVGMVGNVVNIYEDQTIRVVFHEENISQYGTFQPKELKPVQEFKKGDKVRISDSSSFENIKGTLGVILRDRDKSRFIAVECDKRTGYEHNCDGSGRMGYCIYCDSDDLEFINDSTKSQRFKNGDCGALGSEKLTEGDIRRIVRDEMKSLCLQNEKEECVPDLETGFNNVLKSLTENKIDQVVGDIDGLYFIRYYVCSNDKVDRWVRAVSWRELDDMLIDLRGAGVGNLIDKYVGVSNEK